MNNAKKFRSEIVAYLVIVVGVGVPALAQQFVSKAPTAADWAALAKLPDFNGVWERSGVGGGGNPAFGTATPAAPRGDQPPAGNRGGAGPQRGGPAMEVALLLPEDEAEVHPSLHNMKR